MNKFLRSTVIISAAYILLRISGFARESIMAAYFSTTSVADAFVIANTLPNMILSFIVSATGTTFISVYSNINTVAGNRRQRFTNNLLTIFFIIGLLLTIAFALFPRFFISILASNASEATIKNAELLIRFIGLASIPLLFSTILSGLLQAHQKFFTSVIYQLFINVFLIIGIWLAGLTRYLLFMGLGTAIGSMAGMFVLVAGAVKSNHHFKPVVDFKSRSLRMFFVLIAPIMLSTFIGQFSGVVERNISTSIGVGVASILNYSSKIKGVFTAVIGASLATAIFPSMTEQSGASDLAGMKRTLGMSIRLLLPVVLPITVGLIILAEPIVRLLFERGSFTREDTVTVAAALRLYAISMASDNIAPVISRAFFARQKTRVPAIVGSLSVGLNILLMVTLVKPMGYLGLALVPSISGILSLTVMTFILTREIGTFSVFTKWVEWLKLAASLGVMSLAAWYLHDALPIMSVVSTRTSALYLALATFICASLYAVMLFLLKTETSRMLIDLFKRESKKIKGR